MYRLRMKTIKQGHIISEKKKHVFTHVQILSNNIDTHVTKCVGVLCNRQKGEQERLHIRGWVRTKCRQ